MLRAAKARPDIATTTHHHPPRQGSLKPDAEGQQRILLWTSGCVEGLQPAHVKTILATEPTMMWPNVSMTRDDLSLSMPQIYIMQGILKKETSTSRTPPVAHTTVSKHWSTNTIQWKTSNQITNSRCNYAVFNSKSMEFQPGLVNMVTTVNWKESSEWESKVAHNTV